MSAIRHVDVTMDRLDAQALERLADDHRAGALVTFSGNVRDHDHGKHVLGLEYEGHPNAADILRLVAEEIVAEFPVYGLTVAHRIGSLEIGEAALVACVSTAHRGEAFAALEALVNRTKERLPVWKHQRFADGTDEWVNCA